ncbi:GGDEF domain-containing protein [Actinomadura craniellae]|uniref:GGDEF domain-containing protein n=1 Tax=Actinomadura craniellae TaxID=2231787 RepID=A0A365GZX1_9ACTN|nr:EAL domain-containing protein [Actinomadura craniellae]RAY12370.1 GGDEF domain-containing protein [Actinomadura craniellae]
MSDETTRRLPLRAVPIGVAALAGVLYAVASLSGWGGRSFTAWAEVVAAASAAGSFFYAARRPPGGAVGGVWRDSWRWFGVSALCWCAGAAVNAVSAIVLSRAAVALSLADLFYLAGMIALATGFVVPVRPPREARTWLRYVADTYVLVCALFVLGWVTQFGRLYGLSAESPSEFLLELLYPLIDTVLVCAALSFVLGAARGLRRGSGLAYLALLAFATADIITTVQRLGGGLPADDPGDIARVGGLLLLGLVPWAGSAKPRPGGDDERGRVVGPGIITAAGAAAAAIFIAGRSLTDANGLEPVVPIVAASAALVLLTRLVDVLAENERLRRAADRGEAHFRTLAENINDVVLIFDADGIVQYASAGAQRTYSMAPDFLLGRPIQEIIHPEDLPGVQSAFRAFIRGDEPVLRVACRVRGTDGTWLPTESTITRYARGPEGEERLLVTTRDRSEQVALQRQVAHLTFHDGLTGLPNRAYFEERTRELLSRRQEEAGIAVVFVDLDGFTAVNDSAGHAAGDQVLAQAARRLRATVQADDTVARWGGDEFAVLVQYPRDPHGAETQPVVELAERLLRVLSEEPYRVGTSGIALSASLGIAFAAGGCPEDDADPPAKAGAELIRNGDLAMARAKELGGSRVEVFAAHMHTDVVQRLELGSELRRALSERQFTVEFQPVVELATSRVTGVEALLRWWRGSVAVQPREFIGPAEESGLMIPLGDWALREACREVARWRQESWEVGLSVNFTARQIAAPRFVESVAEALEETGFPPHALTLEVKEEVLVEDGGQNVERLSALRELGVRLAIDDFGTGYASLAYLGQLPVDVIKIDPSFVAGLGRDETLTLLTRTIVRLGSDLGLTVVAEGIERPEQLELLREMGCPRGQGFLVARPMAAGRAESLVRTGLQGGAGIPLQGVVLG